jgi:hypothetical protein
MTLFSILIPLISATAPFGLAYCRFVASFMRAPVELVEIAIRHPYHFPPYIFLFGPRRSKLQTRNWYAAVVERISGRPSPLDAGSTLARQLSDAP